jgi:hypothetical protein
MGLFEQLALFVVRWVWMEGICIIDGVVGQWRPGICCAIYVAFIGEASWEKEYAVRYGLHLWKKRESSSEKSSEEQIIMYKTFCSNLYHTLN